MAEAVFDADDLKMLSISGYKFIMYREFVNIHVLSHFPKFQCLIFIILDKKWV